MRGQVQQGFLREKLNGYEADCLLRCRSKLGEIA
jgi:hypothetical protein